MLLADSEARVLRGLFEAEHEILPLELAGGLRRVFELHQIACVYYDDVRRFYEDVRAVAAPGALREADVADFLNGVEQSPDFFDVQVAKEFRDVDLELKRQEAAAMSLEARNVIVPPDPILLRPVRARVFGLASTVNAIFSVVLKGKDSAEAVEGWIDLAERLAGPAASPIELLREAARGGQLARH